MSVMAKKYDSEKSRIFYEEMLPHADAVVNFAYYMCQSDADSDDLMQDTFLRAWKSIDSFEVGTNAKAWLMTICRNLYINEYRKKKKRGPQVEFEDFKVAANKSSQDPHKNPHLKHDIHSKMMGDEMTSAIQKLSKGSRLVILLSEVEEFSYDEIAAIADIPIGTVRSRLFRAKELLRKHLKGYAKTQGIKTNLYD
jgi:RNA polymerase sigma factor (sigma-70 family)